VADDQFQLAHDGADVADGTMDVGGLAAALSSLNDSVKEANRVLNGNAAVVSLRAEAGFHNSSFEIALILNQDILAGALLLGQLVNADEIIKGLFGAAVEKTASAAIESLSELFQEVKREETANRHPGSEHKEL
jgi:hypothetical protein